MKKALVLVLLFISVFQLYSQKISISERNEQLYNLYVKYCLTDCDRLLQDMSDIAPPPPPLMNDSNNDTRCTRKYNIPPHELLNIYPFNLDSVVLVIPEICFWENEADNTHRLGAFTSGQLAGFTDILYNYDYTKVEGILIESRFITGCGRNIPSFRLLFYKNSTIDCSLDIYVSEDEMYFEDSIGGEAIEEESGSFLLMNWGDKCDEKFTYFRRFIQENFGYTIAVNRYENDCPDESEEIILPLKERKEY